MSDTPAWVGVTYLIYIAMIYGLTLGVAGYAVFWMGFSGWWILAAFLMACCAYRPGRWNGLVTGRDFD